MSDSKPCAVDGCDRDALVRGWCNAHHQRVLRLGHPGPAKIREVRRRNVDPFCTVVGCVLPSDAHGWCKQHYRRWLKTGDPGPLLNGAEPPIVCAVDGCDRPAKTRGWCRGHYSRWWAKGDPGGAYLRPLYVGCKANGCDRQHFSREFCELHYRRWQRGVRPGSLNWEAVPTWSGEITYHVAHSQIVARRGKASSYLCSCGAPAKDWAYQHNDPDAREDERGYMYSLNYDDYYEAMCRSCHNTLDRDLDERASRRSST